MKLSIIIPVLNEADTIQFLLDSLQKFRNKHEVIIVDGGSKDKTFEIAKTHCDKLLISERGRAKQMNTGASHAKGDLLLFLHADTRLPNNLEELLQLSNNKKFWGRFDLRLTGDRLIFRLIEVMINLRSRITGMATGDQAIFISKILFEEIDGYDDIELMEDIAICKRLKVFTKPFCLKSKVETSSRRWEKEGVYKTIVLMWWLRLLYFFGVSPKKLSRLYV